jgi:hypothetical protein
MGIDIPAWLRPPPRPRRPRAAPASHPPTTRPAPDPTKPSWRLLRAACRADTVSWHWRTSSAPPHILVHNFRHLLSREVIDLLRTHFKFLNAM